MTNKSSTKKALLMSALSLFVCVSMLIGSTFAWFTDSVTSGGNKIVAGTLDVQLLMDDDVDGNYDDISDSTQPIFGVGSIAQNKNAETLWEPGKTQVAYLAIKNNGNLALKYTVGLNVQNVSKDLYEVMEYAIIADADANNKVTAWESGNNVVVGTQSVSDSVSLAAGAIHYFALAVHMDETAGNDYQGGEVNFDLTVLATQDTVEADSFDTQYDVEATYMNQNAKGEWEISSIGQLLYFTQSVNAGNDYAGETIVLTNDIDMQNINWTPVGNWDNTFSGTFDGQGYTLSNLYINDPSGEGVGLFGVTQNATIKNTILENVDINAYSMVSAFVGASYPSVISDCHVTGDINIVSEWAYVGGIAGYCYYGTQVSNCSVIADDTGLIKSNTRNGVGGITAWLLEGDHKVLNCKVKNLDLVGWTNIGGITGFVHYSNTIDGCSVENVSITKTRVDGHPGLGLISGGFSYNANKAIALTNNTLKNITLNGTAIYKESANYLYGSEYRGGDNANFVLNGNTEEGIENNIVYVNNVNKVSTANELQSVLNGATTDVVIQLSDDISGDVTATQTPGVRIVIDGNNKSYAGVITVDGKSGRYTTAGITIKNINFVADSINADACVRLGDGTNATRYTCNVEISGCTFDVAGAVGVKSYTGGDKSLTITDCIATTKAHSLVQAKGIDGVLVENCEIYSKNGLNFNNSDNVTVLGCVADVKGYAVRFGESSGGTGAAETYLIKNCNLKSACDDGDAVVILRGTADYSTLTIVNTVLSGSIEITNTATDVTIVK